jgi:predicted AlkP superfamily pyrophosphatase or phosphodiesterase
MYKLVLLFLLLSIQSFSQKRQTPKLVVGIVVDQMRYDFLYRYQSKYSKGGFMRLINEGINCENTHYNYAPTYTGPGHASIYTGTTPSVHGIVGNNWWDYFSNAEMYCSYDSTTKTIGNGKEKTGKMSSKNLLVTTISDELRLATNFKSKVIGIALKDRGAIFPAGHAANAAYWYDASTGCWISSSHYLTKLPTWVDTFNAKKYPKKLIGNDWHTLLPIEQYTESAEDDNSSEGKFNSEQKPVFPHLLNKIIEADATLQNALILSTPFGNSLTTLFAEQAIINEELGNDSITDFLAISYSSTDYVGHKYGPNSIEMEDTYLRLDKDLEQLIDYINKKIGKENVLIFLTADHGAAHATNFLKQHHLPSGIFNAKAMMDSVIKKMNEWYGNNNWVIGFENQQIYFNHQLLKSNNLQLSEVTSKVSEYLKWNFKELKDVIAATDLFSKNKRNKFTNMLQSGFYQKRCGDVFIILESGWMSDIATGTTHGTYYNYDTQVPLLWWGGALKKTSINKPIFITDIAPTLANYLHIQQPSGSIGKTIPINTNQMVK